MIHSEKGKVIVKGTIPVVMGELRNDYIFFA